MEQVGKLFHRLIKYALILIISLALGITSFFYTLGLVNGMIEKSLIEIAKQGAIAIENDINWHLETLQTFARFDDMMDESTTVMEKLKRLCSIQKPTEDLEYGIAALDGTFYSITGKTYDVSREAFFINAKNGLRSATITEQEFFTGNSTIAYAVPMYKGTSLIGVLCALRPAEVYCKLVEKINFGNEGYGYIIDFKGNTIAHINRDLVRQRVNSISDAENDSSLKKLAGLEKRMILGDTGSGSYLFNGQHKIMGFTRIQNMDWSFAATAPRSDFNGANNILLALLLYTCVFGLFVFLFRAYLASLNRRLKRKEQSFKSAIEAANIIIISFLEDGFIINFNTNAEKMFGYSQDQVVKVLRIYDFLNTKDQEKLREILEESLPGTKRSFELCIRTSKGESEHILFSLNTISSDMNTLLYELMGIDITDRVKSETRLIEKHEELSAVYEELAASEEELKDQLNELIRQKVMLQEKDERHNLVVDASNIGIWDWDMTTGAYTFSDKWYGIFETEKDEREGRERIWDEYIVCEDRECARTAFKNHIENKTPSYECEYRINTPDGKIKWVNSVGKALWDSDGKPVKMAGAHTDITARKKMEEKVNRLAYYDTLTGLPNRSQLFENFNTITRKTDGNIAFIFIDLDNFKLINDSYGHSIGDKLLIEVSKRLTGICTEKMHLSRLGGDEYAIMVWDYEPEEALSEFVNNLIRRMEGMIRITDYNISLSINIGVSIYPTDAGNFDELIKNADTAMFKAAEKKCKYLFYSRDMNEALLDRLNMRNNLQTALANNEFVLYYQPQYRTSDKKIMGFEALIRWKSESHGIVSPAKFIPIAEESGLIIPLGEWILKEAFGLIKRVHNKGYHDMIMSVNISVIQLIQSNFAEIVLELIESLDLPSECIELEITESAMMESVESVLHNIIILRAGGVRIALDDFGTGYSSLNYLTKIPINTLKIDKSFIDNIGQMREKSLLIGSIVDISRRLGLSIVAEGVETVDQFDYLARRRCERIQGFLFSKPLPETAILELLDEEEGYPVI